MKNIKKIIAIILICIIALPLGSCAEERELEFYVHTMGLYVDKNPNKEEFIVSLEIIDTNDEDIGYTPKLVEGRGKSMHEALRNVCNTTGRKVSMSHCSAVVFGKSAINEGLVPVLDLIYRDSEVRADMFIIITKSDTAIELLKKSRDQNEVLSFKVIGADQSEKYSGEYVLTKAFDIIDAIEDEGIDPVVCNIESVQTNYENVAMLKGAYLFNGDMLSGYIDEDKSKILNLLINPKEVNSLFEVNTEDGTEITYDITAYRCKIKPLIKEDKIVMQINIDMNGIITEINGGGKKYLNKQNRYYTKKKLEEKLENEIRELVYDLQYEYNSDAIGFGRMISRKNPKIWNKLKDDWVNNFKKVEVEVNCNANIRAGGLSSREIEKGK